ncbi:helix-turn-helix domain-containing protein [Methylophaga sulfidovorans]|uniref:Transcriptional regulator, AraC family n=1 Tax=Methylophaga sulfidovorans TaxID=45496 RepID=A0A1I4A9E0_9GAMM|nr:helix-turn-helix domain-containing protein [Methylophaga sulfidovorans]SFK52581.1 transcriptional regulator, AraC family [Methylophaga sulfidovorans]
MTDRAMGNIRERSMNTSLYQLHGQRFCTDDQPHSHRLDWLKEVIGREYANVDVTPFNDEPVFNEMAIYPWSNGVRFSPIKTHSLQIERLSREPTNISQDCYFAVLVTKGKYKLEQDGREVFLEKGDMTLYDATQWHRITMPQAVSKVIISLPRDYFRQRISHIGNLTAKKISTKSGTAAITASCIQSLTQQLDILDCNTFHSLHDPLVDLLTLSLNQLEPKSVQLSNTQSSTLFHVKRYINQHCHYHDLSPKMISEAVGLSVRYINNLLQAEHTSLMRYVTQQRLNSVYRKLNSRQFMHRTITEIALESGFNNMAHFSRAFKAQFGLSPRQFRQDSKNKMFLFDA